MLPRGLGTRVVRVALVRSPEYFITDCSKRYFCGSLLPVFGVRRFTLRVFVLFFGLVLVVE